MELTFSCISGGIHPAVGEIWYRVPSCKVSGGERYSRYLCSALFMTMHNIEECNVVRSLIGRVKTNQSEEEIYCYNDTCVKIYKEYILVEIVIEEDPVESEALFTISEFENAVVEWSKFLGDSKKYQYEYKVSI